jgi:subfamily B ATP-binding cassette protein MsbA
MDGAELGLIYALLAGMLDPCKKASAGFSRLKRAAAAIDRIFQLMDQQSQIVDPPEIKPLKRHCKAVEFKDVSFRYLARSLKTQRGLALEHVDLTIPFGEAVAIVGQNGCGKSTLVNLLPRFYDPEAGDVLVDGRSLKDMGLADLRGQVGIVTQDTVLFDGTVLDNIRYGTPHATREEVEEAARQAHVLPILQTLPQGFDTVIGDQGKELSGGQRQRIALARVILRDPAILILDEATSAADAESEALIHQTLKQFVKGRTTFLISHTISQSLLDFITRIVVMENGKVVAVGSHEQLLQTCPLYGRLYHSPSRKLTEPIAKAA